jgi:hypothetical protein
MLSIVLGDSLNATSNVGWLFFLLDGFMLAHLDCRVSVKSLGLTANAPVRSASYSKGSLGAFDTAKHLQRRVILAIYSLDIGSSCGLDTYIDASTTSLFAFTPTFIMQVSVHYIMADKSMRPDTGQQTSYSHYGLGFSGE